MYDLLRITTTINATGAGLYHLAAALTDPDGQLITGAAQANDLVVGGNVVVLQFPGGQIRQHCVNGPYKVTQVILTSQAGDVIDQQSLAAMTKPYAAAAFDFPLVTVGGDSSDAAVDVDNDGHNDYLNIHVPIQPGSSGVVVAQGRLVDKHGSDIQWVEANAAVTAGVMQTVTLPYSATQILSHGVDGPYELRNVLFYNSGDPSRPVADLPVYVTAGYRHTDLSIFIGPRRHPCCERSPGSARRRRLADAFQLWRELKAEHGYAGSLVFVSIWVAANWSLCPAKANGARLQRGWLPKGAQQVQWRSFSIPCLRRSGQPLFQPTCRHSSSNRPNPHVTG